MVVEKLFSQVTVGELTLPHRVVMSPLTRFRSDGDQVPHPFVADYYAQRATCQGLIITESASIAPKAAPFPCSPGIYSKPQIEAWKEVAKRVHETGGKVFMQLWHAGRECPSAHLGGDQPVSSSAVERLDHVPGKYSELVNATKVKVEMPRALEEDEVKEIVDQFATAAHNAVIEAGFDGIEIHGANGWLVDQFLRDGVNKRTDSYGGSIEKRCKFVLDILHAVAKKIGQSRLGIRFNPFGTYNGMSDSDPMSLFTYLFETLSTQLPNLAFIHITELNIPVANDIPVVSYKNEIAQLRKLWAGTWILNRYRLSREQAIHVLEEGEAELLAFGYDFIANPDLPFRLSQNLPLNSPDRSTFYTNGEAGYSDYPFFKENDDMIDFNPFNVDMVDKIFTPVTIGELTLPHRIVLAPLTRLRATENHVPKEFVADYYAQRATCQGLLITEGTGIDPKAGSYEGLPGIYSAEQIEAWRQIVTRVHDKGGKIFMQLWHAGRVTHSTLLDGETPVSSSAVKMNDMVLGKYAKAVGLREPETPRALEEAEVKEIVEQFVKAAENAVFGAGFDGVEIHAANGYLIDQFLRDGVNQRTDSYGGSIEKRCKFTLDILDSVAKKIGVSRLSIRFSPVGAFNSMTDSDPMSLFTYLFETLNKQHPDLAYIHLTNNFSTAPFNSVTSIIDAYNQLRQVWTGPCIFNLISLTREEAIEIVEQNQADLVAIGRDFLANPDLPLRLFQNYTLNIPDQSTFYTHDEVGYTDYPFYNGGDSDFHNVIRNRIRNSS